MQKGWTPSDFEKINENIWFYYIVAYELAQEKEQKMLNELKEGVML